MGLSPRRSTTCWACSDGCFASLLNEACRPLLPGDHLRRGRYVFASLDGERRDSHGCTRALDTIAEGAGLEVLFGWHVLRHTTRS